MDRDMLYKYVELMNQYSVNNTLTQEDISFVNQVNQISQNDSNLIQLLNQIRQTMDPNERLNLVNEFYAKNNDLNQSVINEAPTMTPDMNIQNQFEAPTMTLDMNVQNQFEAPTMTPDMNVQSQFQAPTMTPDMNIQNQFEASTVVSDTNMQNSTMPVQEINSNLQDASNINLEQPNQENNYNNFIDNVNSDNYEANVYDKPKELKKAGFVNPFIFSLILGFVGGAIVTTLMIILK